MLHNLDKHYMNVRTRSQAVHDYGCCVGTVLPHRQTAVVRVPGWTAVSIKPHIWGIAYHIK